MHDLKPKRDLRPASREFSEANQGVAANSHWQLRPSERRALLLVMDLLIVNGSIFLGLWIWLVQYQGGLTAEFLIRQIYWFPALSSMWLVFSILNGFYDSHVTSSLKHSTLALIKLTSLLLAAYALILFMSSPGALPRRFVIYFIAISFYGLAMWRFTYTVYLGRSRFQRRALILGNLNEVSITALARIVKEDPGPHYQIMGIVGDGFIPDKGDVEGLKFLGTTADLLPLVKRYAVSEVVTSFTETIDADLIRSLIDCQEQGVQVTPLATIYEELTGRVPLDIVQQGWLSGLPLHHASTGVIFPLLKRALDLTLASLGIMVLASVFPFVALAIRLDSKGPIMYRQERVGKGRQLFRAYKFRSMELNQDNGIYPLWTEHGDSRVTRMGRILRATHIDELPQFVNILKGEMSAVGPRPERKELAVQFEEAIPFYRLRYSVRPGMAGWALINQGNTSSLEDAWKKLEYDLFYIKHQSLWFDFVILLKTVVDAFRLRGG